MDTHRRVLDIDFDKGFTDKAFSDATANKGTSKSGEGSKSNDIPKYPCNDCDRHQGMNGFHRRDHLVQHQKSCPGRRVGNEPQGQRVGPIPIAAIPGPLMPMNGYPVPSIQVPQIPPYPCTILGCDKVDGNGYLRPQDLAEHQFWVHSVLDLNDDTMPPPATGIQPFQLDNTQVYPGYRLDFSQAYQQGETSQLSQLDAGPQPYQQPISDPLLYWTNTAPPYGQYDASQPMQPNVAYQAPQPETAFGYPEQNGEQDDTLYFDQQGGSY
ncbi:hypothetical protein F5Y02DRAFT_421315 [Annulohypoxylon stygium]|nr:hypothetical protein F5Y02DRAFT_421315 [Annulohypoxylon stygium]